MNQVSALLRRGEGRYFHWCPACEQTHPLPDSWTFNGDVNKPDFSPSFAQTFHGILDLSTNRFISGRPKGQKLQVGQSLRSGEFLCHYFIRNGNIQFCSDSWHRRSDIIAMPLIPAHLADTADDGFQPSGIETQD